MALVKCPECGKEISDRAGNCPNCGYPIATISASEKEVVQEVIQEKQEITAEKVYLGENEQENEVVQTSSEGEIKKKKSDLIKFISLGVAAVAVIAVIIVITVVNSGDSKKEAIYNEAQSLVEKEKYEQAIEKYELISGYKDADDMKQKVEAYGEAKEYLAAGKYEEANETFQSILGFADVDKCVEQIKWETRTFDCVKSMKDYLKNPDSLQIYDVIFYELDAEKLGDSLVNLAGNQPACVIHEGAQNGFGGNTTGYSLFFYSGSSYQYIGSCDTLDKDKVEKDDKAICETINKISLFSKEIGDIDINRVKQILKDSNYTSVKIIN